MLRLTDRRKRRFAAAALAAADATVGFVDVGAGGALKAPWPLLPPDRVRKFDFEPDPAAAARPVCVSDRSGPARLFVARDRRSSSLHEASTVFNRRFGSDATLAEAEIDVDAVTLDEVFDGRLDAIDLLDINAEGHDARVLQGARRLLCQGVSLIRIEVLFAAVWSGQGWFSDIDSCLRSAGYDLIMLALDTERPIAVRRLHHAGEVVWGKAVFVPGGDLWATRLRSGAMTDPETVRRRVIAAVVLYVLIDAPGRAMELIDAAVAAGVLAVQGTVDLRGQVERVFRYTEVEARAGDIVDPARFRRLAGAVARAVRRR